MRLLSVATWTKPTLLPAALLAASSDGRRVVIATGEGVLLLGANLEQDDVLSVEGAPTAPLSLSSDGGMIGVVGADGVIVYGDVGGWRPILHMPEMVAACGVAGGVAVGQPGLVARVGPSGVDRSVRVNVPSVPCCLLVGLGDGLVALSVVETVMNAVAMVLDLETAQSDPGPLTGCLIVGGTPDASLLVTVAVEGDACELFVRATGEHISIGDLAGLGSPSLQDDGFGDTPPARIGEGNLLWRTNEGRFAWFDLETRGFAGWLARSGSELVSARETAPCDFDSVHHVARVGERRVALVYMDGTLEMFEVA
jgi:hypothetical protein